jgi:hypothetical protein
VVLYRPVGFKELQLIAEADFRAFPSRLPEQPFFYPVLNFEYAVQIARDWNAKGDQAGFVTKFEVEDAYLQQFPVRVVGSSMVHRELWVPAEELAEFNRHIIGQISIETAYYGERFADEVDPEANLPMAILKLYRDK